MEPPARATCRRPPSVRSQRMLHAISVFSAVTPRPLHHPHSSAARARRRRHRHARSAPAPSSFRPRRLLIRRQINLVTVNDFHGRIERTRTNAGPAIAALAAAVKQIRAANPNTVFAAAGDLIGASTFTSFIQQDVPTIEALNEAGLDVSAAGNHEFDQGYDDLIDRATAVHQDPSAARLGVHRRERLRDRGRRTTHVAPDVDPDVRRRRRSASSAPSPKSCPSLVSPAGIATLEVRRHRRQRQRRGRQLTDGVAANGEADVLVLLVHEGAPTPTFATMRPTRHAFGRDRQRRLADVDAIVSGHTHLAYNLVIDAPVAVISSGQYGEPFSDLRSYRRSTRHQPNRLITVDGEHHIRDVPRAAGTTADHRTWLNSRRRRRGRSRSSTLVGRGRRLCEGRGRRQAR